MAPLNLKSHTTDAEHVQSVRNGNRSAFDVLMRHYKNRVYAVALGMISDFDDAETVAQEAFVQAYLSLDKLNDPTRFGPWVCGICRNIARMWLRHNAKTESLDRLKHEQPQITESITPIWRDAPETPQAHLEKREQQHHIQNALHRLPEKSREVIMLFYLEDRSYAEVAKFLGVSQAVVQSRLQTARDRLRNYKGLQSMIQDQTLSSSFEERVNIVIDAVQKGDISKVKSLIEKDQKLANVANKNAQSLIQLAANYVVWHRPKHREIVQYLLDNGAECDIFTAARAGLLDHVKHCLKTNLDLLNAQNAQGMTPMQCAALIYGKHEDGEAVVWYLVDQGAKIDIFTASHFDMLDQVKILLEANPALVSATSAEGFQALHWCARPLGNLDDCLAITKLLLEKGADVNFAGECDWTPLHCVAEWWEFVAQAQILLDHGANINAKDHEGNTPLDLAIDRKRNDMIKALIERGAKTAVQKI